MEAFVVDPSDQYGLRLANLPDPVPLSGELVVRVQAVALNPGEARRLPRLPPGSVPGWDFVGTVVHTAPGLPAEQSRVLGIAPRGGAWADFVAADASCVAEIAANLPSDAVALATGGLTALRLLRVRPVLGRHLAVTGANGAVGQLLIQLAKLAGANVTASVRSLDRAPWLNAPWLDGSDDIEVIDQFDEKTGPFDLIVDGVGGQTLSAAIERMAIGGTVIVYGASSGVEAAIDTRELARRQITIVPFGIFGTVASDPPASDLGYLASLMQAGRISAGIGERHPRRELPVTLKRVDRGETLGKVLIIFM